MIADCTGLVLAGGDSRRMGRDKTRLEIDGQTLLQRAVDVLQGVFPQVLVSVRQRRDDVAVPQVLDGLPDAGPLAGLCAGLAQAGTPWVFAVAADMPFLDPQVIRLLAGRRGSFQAVVPVIQGFPQPLAAYYAVTALPIIRAAMESPGKHSLRGVLERLDVCLVHEDDLRAADPGLRGFIDLDTPEDLAAARNTKKPPKTD
jgi:molybdopterin-guanine dinucleotide biosynthesis protein A